MNTNGQIPLVDLVTPHQELEDELVSVFKMALKTAGFIGGPMVEAFEREFAEFCEAQCCVGVGSGTDALRFALIAAGVQPGDTVVTVERFEAVGRDSGAKVEFPPVANVWRLRSRLVVSFATYYSLEEALETLGLSE